MDSDENLLWEAATKGDLDTVKRLLRSRRLNVNWADSEFSRTPFYRACGHGRTSVVEYLLHHHPEMDVNLQNSEGATPLNIASQQGHPEVVKLLLEDPRVNPMLLDHRGRSPFFMACQNGRAEVVSLLLLDGRSNVNLLRRDRSTPIWFAAQNGHLPVVQLLLATDGPVNTMHRPAFNPKTAAEHARAEASGPKLLQETEEDFKRRCTHCSSIADLIENYNSRPAAVREYLRGLPHIPFRSLPLLSHFSYFSYFSCFSYFSF